MLAVYGIVGGNEAGWTSARTLGLLGASVRAAGGLRGLGGASSQHPLVPLRLFALRNVAVSQVVGVLWAAAMFAWFFLAALYLQQVLAYDALEVGLAFLPDQRGDGLLLAEGLRPARDAVRHPPAAGRRACSWPRPAWRCSRGPRSTAASWSTCCRSMILLGVGAGIAFNPVLLAAMGDVEPHESGLASGCRQHQLHDGRRARPGRPGQPVRAGAPGRWSPTVRPAGGAQRGLPGRVRGRCRLRRLAAAVIGGVFLRPKPMQMPEEPEPSGRPPADAAVGCLRYARLGGSQARDAIPARGDSAREGYSLA